MPTACRSWLACRPAKWGCWSPTSRDTLSPWRGKSGWRSSILAFNVVKWIGVAYLIYLAVRQWRTATIDLREQIGHASSGGRLSLVLRGFLVNATNPKGLVFFLAVLPQFVVPTTPLLPQYLAIGATMVGVDLVVMRVYSALAARLLRWMNTPRQQTAVNRMFSAFFATAAVVLSLVRRGAASA